MRRWLKVIFILGVFVAFCLFSLAALTVWDTIRVHEEMARLKRESEPTSWQEIAPPVPKHLDGTTLYRKAFAQLEEARRKFDSKVWQTYNPQVLQAAKPALQTLRKAIEFPHMRLIDPKQMEIDPLNATLPQFSGFREFVNLLRAEAAQRKRRGDIKGAVESCLTILKLCRRIGDEPSLLTFLVQSAIFSIGLRWLWEEILANADVSRETYLAALSEIRAWDIDQNFVRALKAERAISISASEFFKRQCRTEIMIAGGQLLTLKVYRSVILIAQRGVPYDRKELERIETDFKQKSLILPSRVFALVLTPSFPDMFEKATQIHALQRVTMTALALRLYRKENGRYPENLQQLVPKYLPSVPIDPYDGKPIRYRKLQKGFKVWSVGGNRKDDGGVKVRDWWRKGDLVLESKI